MIGYYVPSIPEGTNTTMYRHAQIIGKKHTESVLITESDYPDEIGSLYKDVIVVGDGTGHRRGNKLYEVISDVSSTVRILNRKIGGSGIIVTTIGLKPILTGYLSNSYWVADVYDDPIQFAYTHRGSKIHLGSAVLQRYLISKSDLLYLTLHPETSLTGRNNIEYGINGAPISQFSSIEKPNRNPLQVIAIGKIQPNTGIERALKGVRKADSPVNLRLYGEENEEVRKMIKNTGISDQVKHYGKARHQEVLKALQKSHVGLCLLPERGDWMYAYPIKVGEYLASGTIPLCSELPGMVKMVDGNGFCFQPKPETIAKHLDRLALMPDDEFLNLSLSCRDRAEEISWKVAQDHFAAAIKRSTPHS